MGVVCKHCKVDPVSYSTSPEWWALHWIAHAKQEMSEVLKKRKPVDQKVLEKHFLKLATDQDYEDFKK